MFRIEHERDVSALLARAGKELCGMIAASLAKRDRVNVAVAGGGSVSGVIEALRAEDLDWNRLHFFVIDEKFLSLDHPESTFGQLREHLVAPLVREGRMHAGHAHPFILDAALPDRGARAYEDVLAAHGFRYDVILLSSGEDCQVGALFAGHHSVEDPHHGVILMDDSPTPPEGRMTSSLSLLLSAESAMLLFIGEGKLRAFRNFLDPSIPAVACPAKLAVALKHCVVFTDLDEEREPAFRSGR